MVPDSKGSSQEDHKALLIFNSVVLKKNILKNNSRYTRLNLYYFNKTRVWDKKKLYNSSKID